MNSYPHHHHHHHHPDTFRLITTAAAAAAITIICLLSCVKVTKGTHFDDIMLTDRDIDRIYGRMVRMTNEERAEYKHSVNEQEEERIRVVWAKIAKEIITEEPLASTAADYVEPIYLTRLIRKYEEETRDTIMELEKEAIQMGKQKESHMDFYGHMIPPIEVSEIKWLINDIRDKERIRSVVVDFIQRMTIEEWKSRGGKANKNKQAAAAAAAI